MAKNGQNHGGRITAKIMQQMAVNSLNTRVQSPYSQFIAFTTIITWRAKFLSVKFWHRGELTMVYWLTEHSASTEFSGKNNQFLEIIRKTGESWYLTKMTEIMAFYENHGFHDFLFLYMTNMTKFLMCPMLVLC